MNFERYHDAIEHVPFNPGLEARVLAGLKETQTGPRQAPSYPRRRVLAVAFAAVLCLALTAGAVGQLSALFAPLFSSHPEIIDQSGTLVSASATNGGYTLTADALFGDRNNLYVAMTLSREDGGTIDTDDLYLQLEGIDLPGFQGGGYGTQIHPGQGDTTHVSLAVTLNSTTDIPQGGTVTLNFSQLVRLGTEDEVTVISEGGWRLSFPAVYSDLTQSVILDTPIPVGDTGLILDRVDLSPLAVRVSGQTVSLSQNPLRGIADAMKEGGFLLTMQDGSTLDLMTFGSHFRTYGGSYVNDNVYSTHFNTTFSDLIPLEEMASLSICGVEIPLDFPAE